jgi:LEA14-like dessication related protein
MNGASVHPRASRRAAAAAAAVLLALAGCESFNLSAILKKPQVVVSGAEIEQVSFDGARVRFDVKVTNPNPVGVRLAGFDYRLDLDGSEFVKGSVNQAVSIAARGTSTVPVPVSFTFASLFSTVQRLADASETAYEVTVGFSFDLPVLGTVRVPAVFKGVLPVLRAPRASVAALRLEKLTLASASLVLSLEVRNPNGFALALQGLEYDFAVAGRRWADGQAARAATIPAGGAGRVDLQVQLDLAAAGRTVVDLLTRRGPVPYLFEGTLVAGTPLPLLKSARVPLRLAGELTIAR